MIPRVSEILIKRKMPKGGKILEGFHFEGASLIGLITKPSRSSLNFSFVYRAETNAMSEEIP